MEYRNHIVAFIDILGFKNLVEKTDRTTRCWKN